jgi:hypothetical protein
LPRILPIVGLMNSKAISITAPVAFPALALHASMALGLLLLLTRF